MLVADEPISALDASTQTSVAGLMRSLCLDAGAGMLLSRTTSRSCAVADRTLVMYRGRIVESGDTETIWNDPMHPYTEALLARSRCRMARVACPPLQMMRTGSPGPS